MAGRPTVVWRIVSHDIMMQVPPAELSMMNATSGRPRRTEQTTFRAYWLGHIGLFGPP
jgi:hypothetical protein